jgi:hypothetical protein
MTLFGCGSGSPDVEGHEDMEEPSTFSPTTTGDKCDNRDWRALQDLHLYTYIHIYTPIYTSIHLYTLTPPTPLPTPQPSHTTDIKRQRLEVIKNAFILGVFLALACYSLASYNAKSKSLTSIPMYVFTCIGILVFTPRLCMAALKFLGVAEGREVAPHLRGVSYV